MTGNLFTTNDVSLINTFDQLGPAVLRIGGNSVNTTCWNGYSNCTPILASNVNAFAGFVKLLSTNWHVIYGVNMASNSPANAAAEALYAYKVLGARLTGFEIGNEPDLYHDGMRPTNYTYANFVAEWMSFAAAITNTVPGWAVTNGGNGWVFTGPATAANITGYTWPFATNAAGINSLLTQHYYRGNGQSTNSTLALLLAPDPNLPGNVQGEVRAANGAKLPLGMRMGECGSFYGGGAPNVSDAYGTSLWVIDFMFTVLLNGGKGINFHGGGSGTGYTPIADNGTAVIQVRPEFYGLKFFSLLPAGNGIPANLILSSNINFTAYGVRQTNGAICTVLNNKDQTNSVQAAVNMGAAVASGQMIVLTCTNLSATNGYTLGGAPINANGSWTGGVQSVVPATNGIVSLTVPPISAVLLTPIIGSPTVAVVPASTNITYGGSATFTANASGVGSLTYQWYDINDNAIAGATNAAFVLTSPTVAASGGYRVIVSNPYGRATNNGILTVNPAALTITANNAGKAYEQTLTFAGTEFTSSGLLNSDTATSVTLTSAGAINTAPVGAYPIVASNVQGTGLGNYTITYNNGTLTVTNLVPPPGSSLIWNAAGTGAAAVDGDGTWSTTAPNWLYFSTNVDWGDQSIAAFGVSTTTNCTVTLANDVTPEGITFNSTGGGIYTIAGANTIWATNSLDIVANGNGVIGVAVGGNGGLNKTGSGTLTVTGANTYTGGTTISDGTVQLGNPGALGFGAVTLNGGVLNLSTNSLTNTIVLNNPINTILASGNYRALGPVTGPGGFILDGTSTPGVSIDNPGNNFQGNITINPGAYLRTDNSEVIPHSAIITNNGGLRLSENGTETISGLFGSASSQIIVVNSVTNTLIVGANDVSSVYAGAIVPASQTTKSLSLAKIGSGVFTVTGRNNTYTGSTIVSNGMLQVDGSLGNCVVTVGSSATLAGTGALSGSVTVQSGGTLTPGDNAIGRLAISNNLTLSGGSLTVAEISKNGGVVSNDLVAVTGGLTFGGTLTVTNIGTNALAAGDSFALFNAGSFSGGFATINLPALNNGLVWNTESLAVNGTVFVSNITDAANFTNGLPSPWRTNKVGTITAPVAAGYSGKTFIVNGAGTGLGGKSDMFYFVNIPVTNSFTLTALISTLQANGSSPLAGVMIRQDLATNTLFAFMGLQTNNARFISRTTIGANSSITIFSNLAAPYWVRIVRDTNNAFTGYISADGVTWTQTVNLNIAMTTNALAGLAVASGASNTLTTATFDNVSVTNASGQIFFKSNLLLRAASAMNSFCVCGSSENFTITGDNNTLWRLEESVDMTSWTPLETINIIGGSVEQSQSDDGQPDRFFRLVLTQ